MGHGNAQLDRGQRPGQGRVRVAVDEHGIGLDVDEDALDGFEHRPGLGAVPPGADAQVVVGGGDAELVEEDVGHGRIVVLAGVDEDVLVAARGPQGPANGRRLDKLGTGPHHRDDCHA